MNNEQIISDIKKFMEEMDVENLENQLIEVIKKTFAGSDVDLSILVEDIQKKWSKTFEQISVFYDRISSVNADRLIQDFPVAQKLQLCYQAQFWPMMLINELPYSYAFVSFQQKLVKRDPLKYIAVMGNGMDEKEVVLYNAIVSFEGVRRGIYILQKFIHVIYQIENNEPQTFEQVQERHDNMN